MEGATWLFLFLFLCSIIFIIVAKFSSFGQKLMCKTCETCDNRIGFKYKSSSDKAANDAVGVVNSMIDYGVSKSGSCDNIKTQSDIIFSNLTKMNTNNTTQNICSNNFDDSTVTTGMTSDIKDKYNTFKKSFTGAVCDKDNKLDQTKFKTFYTDVVGMVC